MSTRDVDFLNALDLNIATVAKIVGQTRQTVSRKINALDDDYFGASSLKKVYAHKCAEGEDACDLVTFALDQYFSEIAPLVKRTKYEYIDQNGKVEEGEYWFTCSDFRYFKLHYAECCSVLHKIAESNYTTLAIIVSKESSFSAKRFVKEHENRSVFIVPCSRDLSLVPTMLSFRNPANEFSLFGADSKGFGRFGDKDAARIHCILMDIFEDYREENA